MSYGGSSYGGVSYAGSPSVPGSAVVVQAPPVWADGQVGNIHAFTVPNSVTVTVSLIARPVIYQLTAQPMSTTTLFTIPGEVTLSTAMELPLTVDLTAQMGTGQFPSDASSVMVDMVTGQQVPIPSPTLDGVELTQQINGASMIGGRTYRVSWSYQAEDGTVLGCAVRLICSF